jgi:hypothetical protein
MIQSEKFKGFQQDPTTFWNCDGKDKTKKCFVAKEIINGDDPFYRADGCPFSKKNKFSCDGKTTCPCKLKNQLSADGQSACPCKAKCGCGKAHFAASGVPASDAPIVVKSKSVLWNVTGIGIAVIGVGLITWGIVTIIKKK